MISIGYDVPVCLVADSKIATLPIGWWRGRVADGLQVELPEGGTFHCFPAVGTARKVSYATRVLNVEEIILAEDTMLLRSDGKPIKVTAVTKGTVLRSQHGDVTIQSRSKPLLQVPLLRCNVTLAVGYLLLA